MVDNAQTGAAAGPSRLVLVVDDDPGIRGVLMDVFHDERLAVAEAENGAQALELAATHTPALILLHMRMPVMNEWEFAAAYRARPGPHAPIVVMTAAQDAKRWCEEIRGDGCLAK